MSTECIVLDSDDDADILVPIPIGLRAAKKPSLHHPSLSTLDSDDFNGSTGLDHGHVSLRGKRPAAAADRDTKKKQLTGRLMSPGGSPVHCLGSVRRSWPTKSPTEQYRTSPSTRRAAATARREDLRRQREALHAQDTDSHHSNIDRADQEKRSLSAKEQKELAKRAKQMEKDKKARDKLALSFTKQVMNEATREIPDSECYEQLRVTLDHNLMAQEKTQVIIDQLHESNMPTATAEHAIANLVTFTRVVTAYDTDLIEQSHATRESELLKGAMVRNVEIDQEDQVCVVPGEDFLRMAREATIDPFVLSLKETTKSKRLTLFIEGVNGEIARQRTARNKSYRERAAGIAPSLEHIDTDLGRLTDMTVIDIQVQHQLQVTLTKDTAETASNLLAIAKMVATRQKHAKRDVFDWCTEGLKKQSRLASVWHAQISTFQNVSVPIANAIVKAYPTARHFLDALEATPVKKDFINNLASIQIDRVTNSGRRIGPVMATRFYDYFTSSTGMEEIK